MLWLTATPYLGIVHDARLYALMALRSLYPDAYGADPWFAGGSQDDWSIYSPLYARLVSVGGLEAGAMLMTLTSGLLFIVAAGVLSRALIRSRAHWLAMMCLVSVPLCYSAIGMFYVREGFATARGLAIPLSMLGVAWSIKGLRASSLAVQAVALAIHPIIALGPAAISVMLVVGRRVRLAMLILAAVVLAGIFLAGEQGVLRMLDGKWLYYVRHSPLIFIDSWVVTSLSDLLTWFGLLLFAGRYGHWQVRHIYSLAALVGAVGMTASLLASQIPVLIVLQAQLWRCLWIVQVLGVVAMVDLGGRYLIRSQAPHREYSLLAVLLALSLRNYLGWLLMSCFIFLRAGGDRYLLTLIRQTTARKTWIWGMCAVLVAILLPGYLVSVSLVFASADARDGVYFDFVKSAMLSGGFGLVPLACWWVIARWNSGIPALTVLVAAVAVALVQWDGRTPDLRYQEARYFAGEKGRLFDAWIVRGDVVYWHQNPERTWFELGTAGYVSATHCSGQVFSEQRISLLESRLGRVVTASLDDATIALAERGKWRFAEAVKSGDPLVSSIVPDALITYERVTLASAAGIGHLCGDSALKYVVTSTRLEGEFLAQDAETFGGRTSVAYYLYSCKSLRKSQFKNAAS